MSMARYTVLLLAGLAMTACSDNSSRSLTAPQKSADQALSLDKNSGESQRVVAGVTGHAEFDVTATPGITEKYEVTAERRADGRVTGELELKQERNGQMFRIHGTLLCVQTAGTVARLAAKVDRSTLPVVQPGFYLVWSVMDNDVKDHEQRPDFSTEFFLYDQFSQSVAMAHCATGVNVGPFYPVKGHLEVRDPSTEVPPGRQG